MNIDFLKKFNLSDEIISKVIAVNVKDDYYWGVERVGNKVMVYCAFDKNDVYDGKDSTLEQKIVTEENLFIRNKEIDHTVVLEKYKHEHTGKIAYVVTSLKDCFCMFEDKEK